LRALFASKPWSTMSSEIVPRQRHRTGTQIEITSGFQCRWRGTRPSHPLPGVARKKRSQPLATFLSPLSRHLRTSVRITRPAPCVPARQTTGLRFVRMVASHRFSRFRTVRHPPSQSGGFATRTPKRFARNDFLKSLSQDDSATLRFLRTITNPPNNSAVAMLTIAPVTTAFGRYASSMSCSPAGTYKPTNVRSAKWILRR
jgi:hypothetical protein